MSSRQILLLVTLLLCASQIGAQVTLTAQNITVQVTTAQPWTDSGLDLQSGDVVEISAALRLIRPYRACQPAIPRA